MPLGGLGTAGLIAGVGGGLIKGITGLFQKKKGNRLMSQNPFPTQEMPPEVLENQQIARNAAIEGMPAQQYQNAQKNIQRNQAAAIAALTERRGAITNIGNVLEGTNIATGNLDAQSAEMRRQNVSQLLGVNQQVASWKDRLFDWNQRQRYMQNRSYAMGLIGAGNANLTGGIDQILGSGANLFASGAFGGGGGSSASTARYSAVNSPLGDTGATMGSPAGNIPYINPNSAPGLI